MISNQRQRTWKRETTLGLKLTLSLVKRQEFGDRDANKGREVLLIRVSEEHMQREKKKTDRQSLVVVQS